ncbi:adenosine deaminase-like [Paramacrobiotus metropolitanus]|uniref:adenosine deaminase-like n=1 Tax=Paramacrobiotus metropolitanus TaxID=2943436 RepID=UPI0024456940|nr:adenosine deaminase-like [Paramacrobiotus metropolitanus]
MHFDLKSTEKWRHLPKVELHCHFEGCIPYEIVIDEHQRQGIPLPAASDAECRKAFVLEKPAKNLEDALPTLERGAIIFEEARAITRVASEVVFRKAMENVKLLELRYCPPFVESKSKGKISMEDVLVAIQEGITFGINRAREQDKEIHVFLIASGLAALGSESLQKAVDFVIRHKKDFVAFDLCGPEKDLNQYDKYLNQVHDAGIGVTIHAAESTEPKNAQIAVEKLHAKRIGHGIKVVQDAAVFEYLRQHNIHLEISPISNLCTGEVKAASEHPIAKFHKDGFSLSINSDDPACFGSCLSDDYALIHEKCGFGTADFFQINRSALQASFVSQELKNTLLQEYFSEEKEKEWIFTFDY